VFPSIVSNIPEIVGKYPEGTIESIYPTSNPVTCGSEGRPGTTYMHVASQSTRAFQP
jgi:hypothetical protein